jgi:hypothetical protein
MSLHVIGSTSFVYFHVHLKYGLIKKWKYSQIMIMDYTNNQWYEEM